MTRFLLAKVRFIPAEIEPGILYVSDDYKIAMHLCACGCGSKVPISLGPTGWKVTERDGGPTVRPSIGSGQLPCRSHYLITNGRVDWARPMSAAQTVAVLQRDHRRREVHYRNMTRQSHWWMRLWQLVLRLLGRG